MNKRNRSARVRSWAVALLIAVLPMLYLTLYAPVSRAQENSRTFPETGKTVRGQFLQYWDAHGGVAQQGFPISDEMQEKSETDGKTYTVQYFERSVFESHPENQPPNDVLLSLLGVFQYKQIYPAGAPGQAPNPEPTSITVPETGKHLGGVFLDYWRAHGGLAQQGFPISDEFSELSALDGKNYKVQYFERAVFEYHPENQAPYNVLLSQLGTFRYRAAHASPTPMPTDTPSPTEVPIVCPQTPPDVHILITPKCFRGHGEVHFIISGFAPNEIVESCLIAPGRKDCLESVGMRTDGAGKVTTWWEDILATDPRGLSTLTLHGSKSGIDGVGYWTALP